MSKGPWNPPSNPLLLLADLEEESAAHHSKLAQLAGHKAAVYRTQAKQQPGAKTPPAPPTKAQEQGGDSLLSQTIARH